MLIRPAGAADANAIWTASETYALDPHMDREQALAFRHPLLGFVDALAMFRPS